MRRRASEVAMLCLALVASCAGPSETQKPGGALPPGTDAPPAVESEAAPVTEVLTASGYLARGKESVDTAQKMLGGNPWLRMGFEQAEVYKGHYAKAVEDFEEILFRYPDSTLAAEAQYMLGLVHDHPHLNDFLAAAGAYRLTVERYPGTEAARRAAERLEIIKRTFENLEGSPHGAGP